jgi:hypothetical protein
MLLYRQCLRRLPIVSEARKPRLVTPAHESAILSNAILSRPHARAAPGAAGAAGASANCAALRPASRPKVAPDIRPVPLA